MTDQTTIGLKAFMDLGNLMANSRNYIDKINEMTNATVKFAANTVKNFETADKGVSSFQKTINKIKTVAYGVLVADVFKAIGSEIKTAASEAAGAVVAFQSLRIQLDTIVARDYSKALGVSIPEALAKTAGVSRDLLQWVRQIAVTSPFTAETLGKVLGMSQAYGFSSTAAKRLIFDVGELASAWGLGNENIEAIIYNFGQIMTQGKVTGYTLRNLARDMVPISDIIRILGEKYKKTKAEITAMFKTGEIGAKEFISTFEELVEKDYPGAMERMSRTFTGALNNVKDLFQSMVGYELLGPVADKLAGSIQDVVASLLTPSNYEKAGNLGQIILYSFERVSDVVTGVVYPAISKFINLFATGGDPVMKFAQSIFTVIAWINQLNSSMAKAIDGVSIFINDIFSYFGGSFTTLTERMRTWGNNIVIAFANGMAQAIVAVLDVINSIGQTITNLLEAHSPPLLLPDLEQWGTNAMMSYLKGWTKVDFSAFSDISSIMSTMINSWSGIVDEKVLLGNMLSSTVALSRLIEQFRTLGYVSEDSLMNLANASGMASEELRTFIKTTFDLIKAQNISSAVSDMFDFSGTGSTTLFGTLVDSFEDIGNLADKFGPQLSAFVREYASDSSRLISVNAKIAEAQNQVNLSTETYNTLLGELEAQLNKITDRQDDITRIRTIDKTLNKTILTDYERERLELEKKQILTERQIRDTKLQQTSENTRLSKVVTGYESEKEALQSKIDAEKNQIQSVAKANVDSLTGQLDVLKQLLEAQAKLNELYSKMINVKVKVDTSAADIDTSEFEDLLGESLGSAAESALKRLDFTKSLDDLWKSVSEKVSADIQKIKDIFAPVGKVWETVKETWNKVFSDPKLIEAWDTFTGKIQTGIDTLKKFWDSDGKKIFDSIGELVGGIVSNLFITNPKTGESVLEIFADIFNSVAETIAKNGDGIKKAIDAISDFINNHAFPAFKDALLEIGTTVLPAVIDFTIKAIPPLMDLLSYLVDHWKVIVTVLGAFQILGLLKGGGQSILGSAMKGLGFIFGGITLLKFLSGGGLAAGGGGILSLLGLGGATAGAAATGTGTASGGLTVAKFLEMLKGAPATGTGVPGASNGWVKAFPEAGSTGIMEILGKISLWATALTMTLSLAGDTPTPQAKSEYENKYGVKMGTMASDEVAAMQRKQLDDWIVKTFGKDGAFSGVAIAWDGVFGPVGSITTGWNSLFGEGGSLSGTKISAWFENTFGEKAVWRVNLGTTWNSIFGSEGSIATSFKNLWGEGGILTDQSILSWINRSFGPDSPWRINLKTSWDSVFGTEGSVTTAFNNLFGEGGILTDQSILAWATRTFGENAPWRINLSTSWNSLFGPEGSVTIAFNSLFGEGGKLSPDTILGWILRTFGEGAPWRINLGLLWSSVFGAEGTIAVAFRTVFGEGGFLSGESITAWISRTFGESAPWRVSLKTLWDGIFGKEGVLKTSFSTLFGPGGSLTVESISSWISRTFGENAPWRVTVSTLWNSVFGKEGSIKTTIDKLFGNNGTLLSGDSSISTWGSRFVSNIKNSINLGDLFGWNGPIMKPYLDFFSRGGWDMNYARDAGVNMVDGLQSGINNRSGDLYNTMRNLATTANNVFNSIIRAHSPSKLFEESGYNIPAGVAQGVKKGSNLVKSAISSLISTPFASNVTSNDNRIYIEMNPSYQQYSSPSDVYHDTQAALASIGR